MTELCGMLERYRNENHKIVQQKDLQIKNIQNSLTDTSKTKARHMYIHGHGEYVCVCVCVCVCDVIGDS